MLLNWQEWVATTPCALRDCQNSIKWSLRAHFQDPDMMKGMRIACESLRNSYDYVMRYLGS